jgi:hypothetical protein
MRQTIQPIDGFVAEGVRVVPRKDADDLDNLIVRAKKPVNF